MLSFYCDNVIKLFLKKVWWFEAINSQLPKYKSLAWCPWSQNIAYTCVNWIFYFLGLNKGFVLIWCKRIWFVVEIRWQIERSFPIPLTHLFPFILSFAWWPVLGVVLRISTKVIRPSCLPYHSSKFIRMPESDLSHQFDRQEREREWERKRENINYQKDWF